MDSKPYYSSYENRYRAVYEAGADRWGYSPEDIDLVSVLTEWVDAHRLTGKRIVEFACGEGAAGVILSRLGCVYHGVDIAPSAVEKARAALADYPNASASVLDMVNEQINGPYDAALDVMGIHMLITDLDREKYLHNMLSCLKKGAPTLFYNECYRAEAYEGRVDSFDQWVTMSNIDHITPEKRTAICGDGEVDVYIPLLAARPRSKAGYYADLENAGFIIDRFVGMDPNPAIMFSASIYAHKP